VVEMSKDHEYNLTLALLHGMEVEQFEAGRWYFTGKTVYHLRYRRDSTGNMGWVTLEDLVEDYCKFYKLGTYGGNDERHDTSKYTAAAD
jgi:hypothetical protein